MKNKPETPKVTLKKLTLENFKNFQKAELELGPFTVLVGANATGKSNLREAFRFLHGIGRGYTLPEIIGEKWNSNGTRVWNGIRGGTRELTYIDSPHMQVMRLSLSLEFDFADTEKQATVHYFLDITFRFLGNVELPIIREEFLDFGNERLFHVCEPEDASKGNDEFCLEVRLDDGSIRVSREAGPLIQPMVLIHLVPNFEDFIIDPPSTQPSILPRNGSRATAEQAEDLVKAILDVLKSMRFPEFRTDLMRQAAFPGQSILTDGGDNLSSVLYTIYQNPQQREVLLFWLQELTPMDVTDLGFFTDEVGQVRVQLVEKDGRKISIFSASDGTLRFLAILAALLSPEPAHFYFFEELESGVHPARQYLLLQLIQEKTKQMGIQVVTTTHSPTILDFAKQDILEYSSLVYRLENEASAHIKRIFDIPDTRRLAEEQGLGVLLASRWFENVMFLLADDEEPEKTEEVAV